MDKLDIFIILLLIILVFFYLFYYIESFSMVGVYNHYFQKPQNPYRPYDYNLFYSNDKQMNI
jgi:hypothetical protein